jgi:membrane-bound ClpP family serine protease
MKQLLAVFTLLFSLLGHGSEPFDRIDLKGSPVAGYLHIPKDRGIDNSTYLYVKYALESFRKERVRFVLLDLNTPGGEVFAALRISEELKKMDREYNIPVIAFVDNWAISAGALLAYSCRYIGAVSESSMGAAEPVLVGSDGKMETASEKMVSALRTEFATAANLYGRNPLIAEAMVDKDVVLVLRKGEIVQLLDNSQILKSDEVINAKGKLLTLGSKQMQELGIADFIVPEMTREGSTFLAGEKIAQVPFFKDVPLKLVSYKNWKVDVFAFLSNPLVSSLLMMGLMIGFYGIVQSHGLGFSSLLGIFCLALILLSSFAVEMMNWLELVFVLLGLILVLGDLFLLSGFGFLGALGLFVFLFGLIAMLLPPLQGFSWNPGEWGIQMSEWIYRLSLFLFVLLLFFGVFLPFVSFVLRKTPSFKKLVLPEAKEPVEDESFLSEIGAEGICFSALRPFGKVQIGDTLFESKTEGEFIASGSRVEVVALKKKVLIVREK